MLRSGERTPKRSPMHPYLSLIDLSVTIATLAEVRFSHYVCQGQGLRLDVRADNDFCHVNDKHVDLVATEPNYVCQFSDPEPYLLTVKVDHSLTYENTSTGALISGKCTGH